MRSVTSRITQSYYEPSVFTSSLGLKLISVIALCDEEPVAGSVAFYPVLVDEVTSKESRNKDEKCLHDALNTALAGEFQPPAHSSEFGIAAFPGGP